MVEWKLVLPLWKIVWTFLKKFKTELQNDPVILLRIFIQRKQKYYLKKTYTSPCSLQHYALFVTDKIWKKLEWLSTDEWFNSVPFSHSVMSDSLWPHESQHDRPPCPSSTPRVYSNSCPLSQWCIQPSHPLLSPSPPVLSLSQHQGLFKWVSSSHQVDEVLEFQLQHQSLQWTPRADLLQNRLVGSPCSPRDSQESSPTPQFKSINSSALRFLYRPTLTSHISVFRWW